MSVLLETTSGKREGASLWRSPRAWLLEKGFSRGYWIFFAAAFFFDAGFAVYVFLFNLFLLDCHYNERAMGWIGGAMTAGSMLGTLPAGALTRRYGLRSVLLALFVVAPGIGIMRALWIWQPAQIALAFLEGIAMSSWGVCFLPAVARLTDEKNRTAAFSLIFSVSIGTGILGGFVCAYLGPWLHAAGVSLPPVDVKRILLICACLLVFAGLIPLGSWREPSTQKDESLDASIGSRMDNWKMTPFLWRFLPCMALWCAILASFTPFANVYLSSQLHMPMQGIGLLFSAVQIVQLGIGILTPALFRFCGLVRGIALTQIVSAAVLALLALTRNASETIALYLIFSAAQWMSSPGLYNLLMNETPDEDRSTAAAMTLFCNALAGSIATALTGALFTRFGYPTVLGSIALAALGGALLFLLLVRPAGLKGGPAQSRSL